MIIQSFSEGVVPKSWKSAQLTPLLKKPSLDHNVASSYRAISTINSEKTEVIWFSSRRKLENILRYSSRVLRNNILTSQSVKKLGISMDRDLKMSTQISKTIQMCFTSLRQIRSIKECLTMDSLKTLASALVLSRIDYGNTA